MIQSNFNPNASRPFLPLVIISVAMHFSILIYVFVLYFMSSQGTGDWVMGWRISPGQEVLCYILTGMAVVNSGLTLIAPKIFMKYPEKNSSSVSPLEPSGLLLNFDPLTARVQSLTVMRMAFAESVAILGFVLAMTNRSLFLALPYCTLGLLLQFVAGPIMGRIFRPCPLS